MVEISYTEARAHLAELLDRAMDDRETIIIRWRGAAPVALIAADELTSLEESAHLLRSPKNAQRLLAALQRALTDITVPETPDQLLEDVGLAASE